MTSSVPVHGALSDFRRDRAQYPPTAWLTQRSLWAVAGYRCGRCILSLPQPWQSVLRAVYQPLYMLLQVATGIELDPHATIGPGLRIHHAGPIVVNGEATIGADCVMNVGNILGNRDAPGCPTLGDRVRLGAGAQILGPVSVGDDAYIGAMSLVLADVPAGAVVAGVPAHLVHQRR